MFNLILASISLILVNITNVQSTDMADAAWQALLSTPKDRTSESANLRYREKGLEFWRQFPSVPRRYRWLSMTLRSYPVHYFQDVEEADRLGKSGDLKALYSLKINAEHQKAWEARYAALRKDLMRDPKATEDQKIQLQALEIQLAL